MKQNSEPRLSLQGMQVLEFFASRSFEEFAGAQLIGTIGLAAGTLYPILARFERVGWIESRWEAEDPSEMKRPRRRYYRITAVGAAKASTLRQLVFNPASA